MDNNSIIIILLSVLAFLSSCSESSVGPETEEERQTDSKDPSQTEEPLMGTIESVVTTSGSSIDVEYIIKIDDSDSLVTAPNDTVYFNEIAEGNYDLALANVSEDCTADPTTQTVAVTGGDTTSVTFAVFCPEVQPLVNKIVFTAQNSGYTSELFVMDPDGSNRVEIDNGSSNGISQEAFPDVSPDGKKIAFVNSKNGSFNIFVENVDGTGRKQLTDSDGDALAPDWSPGGSKIAFYQDDDIYVMNADGTDITQLTDTGDNRSPSWSPDGSQIAFMSFRDGDGEIFVMNSDGSEAYALTSNEESDRDPAWSPEGHQIAFTSYRDGQEEIYVMNADGSDQVRLTEGRATYDNNAAWSPDGKKIAFRRHSQIIGDFSYSLCTVSVDGSDLQELLKQEDRTIRHVDWSPGETE